MQGAVIDRKTSMIALFPVKSVPELAALIWRESGEFPEKVCVIAAVNSPSQVSITCVYAQLEGRNQRRF